MSDYFNVADIFGENVFNDTVMQERLPKKFTRNSMRSWMREKNLILRPQTSSHMR